MSSKMDEAFTDGYIAYLAGHREPPKRWPEQWKWAWSLGWRLHEFLIQERASH